MTRVGLIGSKRQSRELASALEAQGLCVVVTAESLDAWSDNGEADVEAVILREDAVQALSLADALERLDGVAVVILTDTPPSRRLFEGRHRGWAILPEDAPPQLVSAAVQTSAAGFTTAPIASTFPPERNGGRAVSSASADIPEESLTRREREVLTLVADGLSNRAIASRLGISEHTVKFHVSTIYSKLGAANRAEAVARGWERGLIAI